MTESGAFHHEAFFYADPDEFLAGTVPFVRDGLAADEAVLVALPAANLESLRVELGDEAAQVEFVDMAEAGRNPARLIATWFDFLAASRSAERGARGIGEPIWAGRSASELDECMRHEALLNLAFGAGPAWSLVCPYDTRLDDEILLAAEHTHPELGDGQIRSADYEGPSGLEDAFGGHLERPVADDFTELVFDLASLPGVRRVVFSEAARTGIETGRAGDLVLAANEIATNSVVHGGGGGVLQVWRNAEGLICDIRDAGRITDPLVGRRRPRFGQPGGRGMWLANQVCDLVQVRYDDGENVVRLRMSAP